MKEWNNNVERIQTNIHQQISKHNYARTTAQEMGTKLDFLIW